LLPFGLLVERLFYFLQGEENYFGGLTVRTNLKTAIELTRRSQIDFAKDAGIHPIRLNRIVNGRIEPTPAERERFAELLNVDAAWLFRIVTIPTAAAATSPDPTLTEVAGRIGKIIEHLKTKS
jgi:transcriptional regulator with XRE-family HTH domain